MQTPDSVPEKKPQPKPKRILLVNEQRSFQMMMKAMQINIGINRNTYTNSADEARRRCQKESFDIYLLDYELGAGENGRQLLESLRDQQLIPPQSVVIMVSSDGSRAMVLSALEAEPDEYLMKPFSQEQFSFRLKRALAGARHWRASSAPSPGTICPPWWRPVPNRRTPCPALPTSAAACRPTPSSSWARPRRPAA